MAQPQPTPSASAGVHSDAFHTVEDAGDPDLRWAVLSAAEASGFKPTRAQIYPKRDRALRQLIPADRRGLVTRTTPVASMGSCFAVYIRKHLLARGYAYLQEEHGPCAREGSCRYGAVYNTGSLAQIAEAAVGAFQPAETHWPIDGLLLSPYRAKIAWPDQDARRAETERHAFALRRMFQNAEVLIFTAGLSEVWRSRIDGATFAAPPPKRLLDPARHRFELLSPEANLANLERFRELAKSLNPGLRFIVTVSPVPLRATFRDGVPAQLADEVSKASLRVAVDRFVERHDDADYFPAYELVRRLTPDAFTDDNIHVHASVVARVMHLFEQAFGEPDSQSSTPPHGAADSVAPSAPIPDGGNALLAAFLRDAVRIVADRFPGERLALFGAGEHTKRLLHALDTGSARELLSRIAFILDDAAERSPAPSRSILGVPVRHPDDAGPDGIAAVIPSSDTIEDALGDRARAWAAGSDAAVCPLYRPLTAEERFALRSAA